MLALLKRSIRSVDRYYRDGRWREPFDYLNLISDEELAQDIRSIDPRGRLRLLPQSFFFGAQVEDFAAEFRSGVSEVHRHTLYHNQPYATGGYTQRIYFGTNVAGATAGLGTTNLQVVGAMAGNEAMVVQYIRLMPLPAQADVAIGASANSSASTTPAFRDFYEVLSRNCYLLFKIADKPYITAGPLWLFGAGMGPGSVMTGAWGSSLANSGQIASYPQAGLPSNEGLYKVDPPLAILPNRTFSLELDWAVAVATSQTNTGHLWIGLDGWRVRAVQ